MLPFHTGKDVEALPPPAAKSEPSKMAVVFAIGLYAGCSSCMLVVNKVGLHPSMKEPQGV
jgi:hypothetical protein